MINVDVGAQRTDAFQECRNMLLSEAAHADALPGLQIEADDVACTHAAAIASRSRAALLPARARPRGDEATQLVVGGFLAELVDESPRARPRALAEALERRLSELLAAA